MDQRRGVVFQVFEVCVPELQDPVMGGLLQNAFAYSSCPRSASYLSPEHVVIWTDRVPCLIGIVERLEKPRSLPLYAIDCSETLSDTVVDLISLLLGGSGPHSRKPVALQIGYNQVI